MGEMVLIAESGASKTAWRLCETSGLIESFESPGLNPSAYDPQALGLAVRHATAGLRDKKITHIHFYGAGLKFEENKLLLKDCLNSCFAEAKVELEDDLMAAIRATGRQEGIVCILGTGSNACYYKHEKVLKNRGGHGYLLGDEGSGMDLGKNFLKGLLQGDFPPKILTYVEEEEGKTLGEIRTKIYNSPQPNRVLAQFSFHISRWIHEPIIQQMVQERFSYFLSETVARIPEHREFPLDFVGSIPKFYEAHLEIACQKAELRTGNYFAHPIDRLLTYHGIS